MIAPFSQYNNVFVEITKSEHLHGGSGWEFGTCLWSPTTNRIGADRYSIMRRPVKGDLVLHFYDHKWGEKSSETRLCGYSIVAKEYAIVFEEPPSPGNWAGRESYYRVNLRDYTDFIAPVPISTLIEEYGDEIRRDIMENEPEFYPFTTNRNPVSTVQGIYLTQATAILFGIFLKALGIQESTVSLNKGSQSSQGTPKGAKENMDLHYEYTEARRRASERYFFARNPVLTRLAKQHYGYICQVCGFDFESKYGELGKEYIEVHHLNPLSERAEKEWTDELRTNISEVTVLCANCHRMIHRKRPALSLEALQKSLQTKL